MADTSALLAQYLSIKAQIGYYQLQDTKWSTLHENMAAKLSTQTSAEGKWESKSDAAEDGLSEDSKKVVMPKGGGEVKGPNDPAWKDTAKIQRYASSYASLAVPQYDPDKLEEYAELDIEYDMMQSTYETLLEQLNSQAESLKSQLSTAAQDTGMLES